jgi:fucose permease
MTVFFAKHLPKVGVEQHQTAERRTAVTELNPVKYPVLWMVALVLFCAAIGEGAMANWSVLFLNEDRGLAHSAAAAGYAVFSVTTALIRFLGEHLERWLGDYALLRASGGTAALGILLAVTLPWPATGYLGLALAGAGFALVFPVAIGQAGQLGRDAGTSGEREVGFVSAVAYVGLVTGPPAIGAAANASSLALALGGVGAVVSLVILFAQLAARRAGEMLVPNRDRQVVR